MILIMFKTRRKGMKNFKNRLLSILLALLMTVPLIGEFPERAEASFEEIPKLSLDKCKKAEITLSETVSGVNMELIEDGSQETSNVITKYGNETGREVTTSNKINIKFTGDFASPDDDLFLFAFRYWDYQGGGLFYFDYSSIDGVGITSRVEVSKRGLKPDGTKADVGSWRWEYVIVSGAKFTQSLDTGADFKLANRANNCFSKIEVYNLAPIREELALIETGTFAKEKTTALFNFGLLTTQTAQEAHALLPNKLSREMAISYTITFLGLANKAKEAKLDCTYTDVAPEYRTNISYAKSIGLIKNDTTTLGAQEIIKERELLEYYLRFFKLPTDGDIIKTAQNCNLVYGADSIFQPEKEALVDNLFAIGSNVLKMKAPNSGEMMAVQMIRDGIIPFKGVMQSGDATLMGAFLDEPIYCPPKEHIDPWTKKKWYSLNFFGMGICRPYMTQQTFSDDNETMVFCDLLGNLYLYNIKTYMVERIDKVCMEAKDLPRYVAITFRNGTSELYWVNDKYDFMMYDVKTRKKTYLASLPSTLSNAGDISVSKDGKRLVFDTALNLPGVHIYNRITTGLLDLETKEFTVRPLYDFTEISGEGYYSMHSAINPVYTNIIHFSSGGEYTGPGLYKSFMRLHRWNTETGEMEPYFDEYRTTIVSGYGRGYGEQNGHEAWTGNGEWTIVNKAGSQYLGKFYSNGYPGLVLISYDGRDRKYLGPAKLWDYKKQEWTYANYTHPGGDPTGERWAVSDDSSWNTFAPSKWPLIIRDSVTGASYSPLNFIPVGPSKHHPHPAFSQNLQYVAFGTIDENGVGEMGWVDVSDITSIPVDGSVVKLSDSCEALDFHNSFENFEYDLNIVDIDGETAYEIPRGKKMYVNALNDVIWGRNMNVSIEITYLDNSTSPIQLDFIRWNNKGINQHLSRRSTTINRTGKGGWNTATITIDDINLDNMEYLGTDFRLYGTVSDIVIKEIKVKEVKE